MDKKEYIERGAFDLELQNLVRECNKNCESDKSSGAFEALYRLRLAPVADVAPVVHGEWIKTEKGYKCSQCNCLSGLFDQNLHSIFCPWCGAKMDGGKIDDR